MNPHQRKAYTKWLGGLEFGHAPATEEAFIAGMNAGTSAPIPMLLKCPECSSRHIDEGEFATKPHHTHACQNCGHVWRPAIAPTVGVQFLPGFKNGEPT